MSKIRFIQAGLFTTVQDGGRRGYQSLGMPTAGAMDTYAFSLANALVGNSLDQSAIEATLLGPTIEIDTDCVFAVTGADMGAALNGQSIELNRAYAAKSGGNFNPAISAKAERNIFLKERVKSCTKTRL